MPDSIFGTHERSVSMAFERRAFTAIPAEPEDPGGGVWPPGDTPFVDNEGRFLITGNGARITFLPIAASSTLITWAANGKTIVTSTGAKLAFAPQAS